jgi:predicted flap endonuclease-1-like 5' DNA nuclease
VIGRVVATLLVLVLSLSGIVALAAFLWWLLNRLGEEPAPEVVEIEIDDRAPDADVTAPEPDLDLAPAVDEVLPVPELEVEEVDRDLKADVVIEPAEAEVDRETEAEAETVEVEADEPDVAEPVAEVKPDDLKRIEGIGPKISSVLQAAGITTYAQLASADVGALEQILEEESPRLLRLADPATWPEQAKLAETGDWDGLQALQGTLRGGRRT